MCRTIMSAGSRRGAMMATMRCDHPDIYDFITAKSDAARLRMFNVSVLITDPFMEAVKADGPWDLKFNGEVYKTVQALELWNKIMQSTYDFAEPGVIIARRLRPRTPVVSSPCRLMAHVCLARSTWPVWSKTRLEKQPKLTRRVWLILSPRLCA
jgi:ribonucleotide reductase alpha subunit